MPKESNSVLVVGAGIGGIKAACDLAELGFDVHLVESAPNIGGKLQQHDRWFPTDDCTMCQSLPHLTVEGAQDRCMRRVLAFPGLTLHAYSELESVSGKAGKFTVNLREKSRLLKPELCTSCGKCADVCPVEVPDAFQGGLANRKAAYILYPGAYPNTYTIDPEACSRCGECIKVCPTGAVDLELAGETAGLEVGAIILAPGFEEFKPELLPNYGYARFPNVVTSTQFERITAGGGLTPGRLTRPSDGDAPSSVAFLTCVGSRDTERPYCSYACCMYTLKEAIMAKELLPDIEVRVFYMDMRAFGKQWWEYYGKAQEAGIEFVRCRIASVEDGGSDNLKISYEDESGNYFTRTFGMVVLATGQVQPEPARKLAETVGIETDEWGFCKTDAFNKVHTSKPGVFAAGSFAGPADIAATVTQSQAAALEAARLLWKARKPPAGPPELRAPEQPATAVFVAGEDREKLAASLEGAAAHVEVVEGNCPAAIAEAVISKLGQLAEVDRVLIVAPVSLAWEAVFMQRLVNLGLAANKVEFVDTRFSTGAVPCMVRAALGRLAYAVDSTRDSAEVTPAALVMGGGVSAMEAALTLGELGFEVHLVNREEEFGGLAKSIHTGEYGENVDNYLKELVEKINKHKKIHKHTQAILLNTAGMAGRFISVIETPQGPQEFAHGAIIIATGAQEYDYSADGYPEGVITQSEFEVLLSKGKKKFDSVVMIQCVGTLNEERPYCSRTCCTKAVKNALSAKKANPEAEVFILCREVMTYGLHELSYNEARDKGVIFVRYGKDRPPQVSAHGRKFKVKVYDPLLEEEIELPADKVVLSTGTVCTDSAALAKTLDVELDKFGFFKEANSRFRPVETDRAGVFVCGLAQGPQTLDESITAAHAASQRAAALLSRKTLISGSLTSIVAERWCVGCELCVSVCPVHARIIDLDTKKAKVYAELCVGCGACATVCPASAARSTAVTDKQVFSTIEILTSQ